MHDPLPLVEIASGTSPRAPLLQSDLIFDNNITTPPASAVTISTRQNELSWNRILPNLILTSIHTKCLTTQQPFRLDGNPQAPRNFLMILLDSDIAILANSAAFTITIATEMFIQYMAEQGHNVVKSERKPRRNIQYRDLSNAVARLDNLEFLSDIVPRTIPYKEVKAKKAPLAGGPAKAHNGEASHSNVEAGQTTLDGKQMPVLNGGPSGTNGSAHGRGQGSIDDESIADPNMQLERESRGARMSTGSAGVNGKEGSQDVEMT
ncbi:hypothetical protein G7Y89_g5976 [Cudoniella acicularis]|uniref:Transcription factor CBF/NF-Y/archaeal histone domain-containing protein n=1 Tax=Cudoniella acicularis TaxID=354080 RepID=A0A8H4RPP2_9HELO|nr:hypothetical protein G7Y89_g5976 [Cudoniella acicularis]